MADHDHGKMDISVQEKTFEGFVKFMSYSIVAIIVFLIFLAMVNG
ncbi:MAG: aa3-type cytochrome c oxidase subunit IV [Litoreibacter sp.]